MILVCRNNGSLVLSGGTNMKTTEGFIYIYQGIKRAGVEAFSEM